MTIKKPTNFVTRQMAERMSRYHGTSQADLCPDLTPDLLSYLEERYDMPIWDGEADTRAEYLRAVGKYLLVVDLRASYEAYT